MCVSQTITDVYQECQARLFEARLLIPSGVNGVYGLSGVFEDIVDRFERLVTLRAAPLQAEVIRFPGVLTRESYLKTSHIENFPDLMGSVHSFTGNERAHQRMLAERAAGNDWTQSLTPSEIMMTPATCYPLYPTAAGTELPADGRIVDLKSFVFRHEPSPDPARMQVFRQREFVRLGTPEQAQEHQQYWLQLGLQILEEVGLQARQDVANDPFFGRAGKVMAIAQKEQDLKFEILHTVASEERPTAIASSNYHLDYFGRAFDIQTLDGKPAHTACIGFGLERIALALFMKHGFDPEQWPTDVQNVLAL